MQLRSVIEERREEERKEDLMVRSSELRALCVYMAAASGSEENIASAQQVTLLPEAKPKPKILTLDAAKAMFGG